jgi:hypothetical protein
MDKIKLLKDLKIAKTIALEFINSEDGGTCNFDCPAIFWETKEEKKIIEEALTETSLYFQKWDGIKNCYLIYGFLSGQGNKRTRMAELFSQSLKISGYKTAIHYQMD